MTHTLTPDIIAVQVPEGAYGLMIQNYTSSCELMYYVEQGFADETLEKIQLPPGPWLLAGKANSIHQDLAVMRFFCENPNIAWTILKRQS